MMKYIWILFTVKESLWCRWIHSNFLKRDNFWIASSPKVCSWAWKKILQLRRDSRLSFLWKIGNGLSVSLWFDHWHPKGPFDLLIPNHLIQNSGLPKHAVVADLLSPMGYSFRSLLGSWGLSIPTLSLDPNLFSWRWHPSGSFSVGSAWDHIRAKKSRVPWASLIWNNDIAPRFQFNLWLIARNHLPTQELLLSYGRIDFATCAFCNEVPDSIDHLFFDCHSSASIAFFWATRCNLPWRPRTWVENLQWAMSFLNGKDFFHSIARFSFAAMCYIIWKKRNAIIFRGETVAAATLKNHIVKIVKDKAITFSNVPDIPINRRLQRSCGFDPSIFADHSDIT